MKDEEVNPNKVFEGMNNMLKEAGNSRQKHNLTLMLDLWEIEAIVKFCKEQNIGVRIF